MKKFGFIALLGVMTAAANAQFSIGNLVVLRAGDGAAALSGSGTAMFIDQFTTAGASVTSTAITTTGANQVSMSGTATAEGGLSIVYFGGAGASVANWGVAYGGYNAAVGTAAVATSTVNRRGGVLRFDSPLGTQTATDLTGTTTPFSGQGIRGLAYDGVNNKFAAVGSGTGVFEGAGTGAGSFVSTNQTNNRRAQINANDIYFSAGGGTRGIWETPGGMSGTGPITSVLLQAGLATSSINDFHIFRTVTGTPTSILWADDVSAAAGGLYFNGTWDSLANGGIGGFTGAGSQIISVTAINTALSISATGLRDFAVVDTDVYATTALGSANHIVKISFANGFSNANTGISLVATAGANTAFRGIEVVPEPASFIALGLGLVALATRRRRK